MEDKTEKVPEKEDEMVPMDAVLDNILGAAYTVSVPADNTVGEDTANCSYPEWEAQAQRERALRLSIDSYHEGASTFGILTRAVDFHDFIVSGKTPD